MDDVSNSYTNAYNLEPVRCSRRGFWGYYLAAAAVSAAVYLASVAPGVLWQDNGLAQLRVLQKDYRGELGLALSHPLFYLIADAFQKLPLQDSAYKTNLVSAACASLAVANLFVLVLVITGSRVAATVGALSLLFAHTFWQHAARPEVYSLTCLLLGLQLLCWHRFYRTFRQGWVVLAMLLNGLSLANHLLALLTLAAAGAACLYLLWRKQLRWPIAALAAGAWIMGAWPYEALILQDLAAGQPLGEVINSALFGVNWRGAVTNVRISGRMVLNALLILLLNFPTPTILLGLGGVKALARGQGWFGKMVLGMAAVHLAFAVRYPVRDQYTFFITTVFFVSLLIGVGCWQVLQRRRRLAYLVLPAAMLPVAVYYAMPRVVLAAGWQDRLEKRLWKRTIPYRNELFHFLQPWSAGYDGPQRFAREVFRQVPQDSILLVDSTAIRPLMYLRLTEKLREDVQFGLDPAVGQLDIEQRLAWMQAVLKRRAVYTVTPLPGYCPGWVLEHYRFEKEGILYRIVGAKSCATNVSGTQPCP